MCPRLEGPRATRHGWSAQGAPHSDDVITDRHSLVLWSEIRECCEELRLIRLPDRVPTFTPEPERHGFEETVRYERLKDGVDVAGGFCFAVSLEETPYLV
jgi:hypothetical protein